jgi:hypothetical protein
MLLPDWSDLMRQYQIGPISARGLSISSESVMIIFWLNANIFFTQAISKRQTERTPYISPAQFKAQQASAGTHEVSLQQFTQRVATFERHCSPPKFF